MNTQATKVAAKEEIYMGKRFAYIYRAGGSPIHLPEQRIEGKEIATKPLDKDWQARVNRDNWWATGYTGPDVGLPKEMALIKRLLAFGGYEACMDYREPDIDAILGRGQLWYGDHSTLMPGAPSQCHRNTCDLWNANKDTHEVAIATGYALSKDGMWRQHSWLMHRRARSVNVIETTEKRVAYYGFVMTRDEAEVFCEENN